MKWKLIRLMVFVVVILAAQACNGGYSPTPTPPKTPEKLATEALTSTATISWALASVNAVTRDGTNVTELYTNFELILNSGSSKTYISRNNNDLFDNSGNWSFAGANFDKFILAGSKPASGREVSFTRTGDNLRLTFTIPAPGARINGVLAVAGSYTFNLVKK